MSLFRRFFSSSEEDEDKPVSSQAEQAAQPAGEAAAAPTTETQADAETDDDTVTAPLPETAVNLPYSPGDGATRQLPAEKVISVSNAHLTFGQSTDVGMVRTNNEDAVLSFFCTSNTVQEYPDFGIFIVADGMGGHYDGEKASAMTTHIIATEVTNAVYLPILSGDNLADMPPITEVLISAVQKANLAVHNNIPKGGGTTCTAVTLLGDRVYIAHVGDSRAYLITKDSIDQITRDHSMVQRLMELGQLTPDEAANHRRSNELYRALGFKDNVEVDALSRRLPPNSKMLMCSDGLWNHVSNTEMLNIVMSSPNPQDACDKLVALANSNGGHDNITVIVLRMN